MIRYGARFLALVACAALGVGCGGDPGPATAHAPGKKLAVTVSDVKLNETHLYIPANVTSLRRHGSALTVSYAVLSCRKPDGVDVTYARIGTTQVISISGLDPMGKELNCSPPSSYPSSVEVPILRGASKFEFTGSPGGLGYTPPPISIPIRPFDSPVGSPLK